MNRSPHVRPNQRQRTYVLMPGALFLLIVVSGCASIDARSPKLQAIKTVGVISAVGDELTLTKAGLTGFENHDQSVSIEPWGIDDLIVSRAGALLSRRFQVQPVTYKRAAFAALERDTSIAGPIAVPIFVVNRMRDDPIKALVRTQVSPQGLDAYVLITKAKTKFGSRGHTITGIGVINRAALFDSHAQAHALYMIRVIDGHDFSVIDTKSAPPVDNIEIVRLAGPSRTVDDSLLPTADDAARNEKLKAAIIDLIERSLPTTLQDLRLVNPS
jgi:hypothetical protein